MAVPNSRGWPAVNSRAVYRGLTAILIAFSARAESAGEYQVKAAFLYNFAKFIEWPPQTFKTDHDPIRICVLGQDPFGQALDDAVAGKIVLGRAFTISKLSDPGRATECQVLFVSSSERKRLRAIFGEFQTIGTLTVGDTEGFATQGEIVNFQLEDGRVRFEINVDAALQAKLRISSKLLASAQVVKTGMQR